jgi:hypothetical protein
MLPFTENGSIGNIGDPAWDIAPVYLLFMNPRCYVRLKVPIHIYLLLYLIRR